MRYENAGLVLKAFRNAKDQTQEELSKNVKVHSQFVSNWERGKCLPPTPAMKKIYKDMSKEQQASFRSAVSDDLTATYMDKLGDL